MVKRRGRIAISDPANLIALRQLVKETTFIPNHEASIEGAIYSVHAKLPKLCSSGCSRLWIPPVKIRHNHEVAGLVVKNYLHQRFP